MWYAVVILTIFCLFLLLLKSLHNNGVKKIKFYYNIFLFHICAFFITAVLWPFFLHRPKSIKNAKQTASILKHITKLYDIKWHLRNSSVLSEDRGAVIIANHQNTLDLLGMYQIWGVADKMTAIAKKELFYMWPFGLTAYLGGTIFIDRNNSKQAYKHLENATKLMVKNKIKIFIFPEGTRNKDTTKLLPFKKGAFIMAVTAQVPIIPVVFSPYYFINSDKYVFNSGHMIIQCLEPIVTAGLTIEDVPNLIQQAYDKMLDVYITLSKEVHSNVSPDYENNVF